MSYYDGSTPTYTFSLRIERNDRPLADTTVEVKATAEEISKAKKTIQRLMNEYAPATTAPAATPEPETPPVPDGQAPINSTVPLAQYRFTCPSCGRDGYGRTNLEDPDITIRCSCGEDVSLEWVPQVKEYRN